MGHLPKLKLPRYVNGFKDRYGMPRYYLRLPGTVALPLPGAPWSPEMMAAIAAASPAPQGRSVPGVRYVYFIRYGAKVKIGTAANVKARLRQLQTGIPGKARIYYVTPGGRALEDELHKLFAADRVAAEWFMWSAAMVEWIAADEKRRAAERQWA